MGWKDGKYYADSEYGMLGDIGNWMGSQVRGSTAPANRSSKMNSMVTGNKYVTGLADRKVNPTEVPTRYGDVGLTPIDPTKVDTYKGLDMPVKPPASKIRKAATPAVSSQVLQPPPSLITGSTNGIPTAVEAPQASVQAMPSLAFDQSGIGNTAMNDVNTMNYLKSAGYGDEANAYGSAMNMQSLAGRPTDAGYQAYLDKGGLTTSDSNYAAYNATNAPKDTFLGMDKGTLEGVQGLASAAGTAYDIYDKMWGGGAKARDAQIENLQAQTANNKAAMQHKKDFYSGAGLAFSGGK